MNNKNLKENISIFSLFTAVFVSVAFFTYMSGNKPNVSNNNNPNNYQFDDINDFSLSKIKRKGIKNIGNSCYLNSFLQFLFSIEEIKDSIIKYQGNNTVLKCIKNIFEYLSNNDNVKVLKEDDLRSIISGIFKDKGLDKQQDSHELFSLVLGILEKEIPGVKCSYELTTRQYFESADKKLSKIVNDDLTIITLPIQNSKNLSDALNNFTCNNSNLTMKFDEGTLKQDSNLSQKFEKLSDYIIIELNRFEYPEKKISNVVEIPVNLNMQPYTHDNKESNYTLIGAILHIGRTINGGHYRFIHRPANDNYILYSDLNVTIINSYKASHEINNDGYVLLYKKL
ncbi:MAG: Clan CA, family C19, ubiquitin hydrolase-like cysteine peptidase [Candidatus Paraimprobicoccus trichonymphae]|uniref:Clan CA, family C19, ubiquitin hydrolase-like cysteine peptidase n=1 Tax=Candidatus Paraimprobicoccus trichonymphae TaxID=3033793 RepID=A0AA48I5T0_9FIRM|nr:MAG: Clan CA, family C19, ubiquitin hydrolase-like cysteine peptidase [Candidatus Paraimprobicoccus trichonymphae]